MQIQLQRQITAKLITYIHSQQAELTAKFKLRKDQEQHMLLVQLGGNRVYFYVASFRFLVPPMPSEIPSREEIEANYSLLALASYSSRWAMTMLKPCHISTHTTGSTRYPQSIRTEHIDISSDEESMDTVIRRGNIPNAVDKLQARPPRHLGILWECDEVVYRSGGLIAFLYNLVLNAEYNCYKMIVETDNKYLLNRISILFKPCSNKPIDLVIRLAINIIEKLVMAKPSQAKPNRIPFAPNPT
ncbi:hypothetical protein FHL15_006191 [Xylaria flabelliformis]|uniref:Uncharacterized protein n=1 Tax=Xylaria flabelliformis TaxID=2512241 RepID=A0A553HXV5_9PEZI|nr:hypothetical protein FHL15_006191 [Xylaria flabelliformis]